ncbi:MAG: MFS transporter [Maricaulaceae bacterium]|jgi:Na+/melibiose symporter-like transporter
MTDALRPSGDPRVATWRVAAYASPAMITSLAWMPLGYVVVKFYAEYTSLNLASIGAVILIARLFDAFSDPLIAYLSDRFDTRWGRRKPWIVLSAPVFATGLALMFMPPAEIHWTYFLLANIVMYSGWTFFEITHIAWGLEFERDYHRRSQIGVLLKLFAYIGSLAFFAFPFVFNTDPGSTEFTRPVMTALGLSVVAAFPILALFAVFAVPTERRLGAERFDVWAALREISGNRSFVIYLAAFSAWALSDAILVALFVIYVDVVHDLSTAEGVILLSAYLSRVLASPATLVLLRKVSRPTAWVASVVGNVFVFPAILLFPQGAGALPFILAFGVAVGVLDCFIGVLAITILGDIIDEDARRTGRDKAASYKASVNLVEKTARALGASASLMIVGAAGVAVGEENTRGAIIVLVAVLAAGPCLLNLASAVAMSRLSRSAGRPAGGLVEADDGA